MSPYRPEFEAALTMLARVSAAMKDQGLLPPVLVGGGAVEIYSNSAITTGDFDLCTVRQDVFEAALREEGFVRPSGPGRSTRGWVHPDLPLGFEVVSDTLLDGNAERDRVLLIEVGHAGTIAVISIEDIIADRMGQYASGTAREMLAQARALFRLYPDADRAYMDRRIRGKRQAIMASTRSNSEGKPISLEEFGREVERRRAAAGVIAMPRNPGDRRTASKRALLKAIEDAGGKW